MNESENRCRRWEELIEACLAGEITAADRAELDGHCASCPSCAGLLEIHEKLMAAGEELALPDRHEMREMRTAVLDEIESEPVPAGRRGFLVDLTSLLRAHPAPAGLAAAATLACAAVLGWWSPAPASLEEQMLRQTEQWAAAQSASLDSYWDAPYSFSNVSVRERAGGRLALSFDAARHVDIEVQEDSPLAREVLLHAILDPSSMGARLQAMEVTPPLRDERLKEALIVTMLEDPDATVRLSALAVLGQYPSNAHSREALLRVLSGDSDVQMRLTALEELARLNVGADVVRDAAGRNEQEGTAAILREAALEF